MKKEDVIVWCRDMIGIVSKHLLLEGQPRVILEESEYVSDICVLYAKETNLFDSFLLLLENGHTEEAVIIFRSMLNNSMLINYLLNGDVQKRYTNYKAQPIKADIKKLFKYKSILKNNWFENTVVTNPMTIDEIDLKINNYKDTLISLGVTDKKGNADTNLLTIRSLAEVDALQFAMYAQYYDFASKYEHSDISSLEVYKKQIDDIPINRAFILTLSETDDKLDKQVLNLAISVYGLTFIKLLDFLQFEYDHLINEESKTQLAILMVQIDAYISKSIEF